MPGTPKKAIRQKAKAGDINARMLLEELRVATDQALLLAAIKAQPMYVLRGVRVFRDMPFPSEHVRQAVIAGRFQGYTVERLAAMFNKTVEQMQEHYGDEIEFGAEAALIDAITTAVGASIMGDSKFGVPLLKARGGMGDTLTVTTEPSLAVADGTALLERVLAMLDKPRGPTIDVSFKDVPKLEQTDE